MNEMCIIGVPLDDSAELSSLAASLSLEQDFGEQRYFDGAAYVELVVPLVFSSASWLTLRTWIRARAEVLKAQRVVYDGVEITAMKPRDAERIIQLLRKSKRDPDGHQ